MAGSTYSSNLKIELMATGENSGTWGNITNTNLGTALEQAVVGLGNPDFTSDANLTITLTNSNAAQAARALVLNVTSVFGSLTATRELIVPTSQKQYIVQNNTTGGQSITVKTSAGTGITVPNGRKAHLYVDGTNVVQMFDFVDINGGTIDGAAVGASTASTGAFTTLTSNSTTTLNGTTVPASVTLVSTAATQTLTNKTINLASNTLVATSAQIAAAVTDETGTGALVFATSPTLVTPALGTPSSGVVTNLTGTASININGTVGATTANTGAFTNLSYTGTLTGGTGVVNIGSGQVYKDASGNVGIGTSSPATKLVLAGNNDALAENNTLRFWDTDTATEANQQIGKIEFFSSDASTPGPSVKAYIGAFATDTTPDAYLAFATATTIGSVTERMRIDNIGNVGIGTSSPSENLDVSASINGGGPTINISNTYYAASSTDEFAEFQAEFYQNDVAARRAAGYMRFGKSGDFSNNASASTFLAFATRNAGTLGERMRIDSAGNVGIGINSTDARLQVADTTQNLQMRVGTLTAGISPIVRLQGKNAANTSNAYADIELDAENQVLSLWAPRSSAPNIKALSIDSAGNVLIGTTTAASTQGGPLQVATAAVIRRWINSPGSGALRFEKTRATVDNSYTIVQNGDALGDVQFFGSDGVDFALGASIKAEVDGTPGSNDMPGRLVFSTSADGSATPTERMRITSAGNVGIGTSSPGVSGLEISRATGTASPTPAELRISTTSDGSDWSTTDPWGRLSFYSADPSSVGPKIVSAIDVTAEAASGGTGNISFKLAATTTGTLTERARIDSSGNLLVGKSAVNTNEAGTIIYGGDNAGIVALTVNGRPLYLNRLATDGMLVEFAQGGTTEGNISVSGTTVSYNGGHLSRWAQTTTAKDESLVKGTVLSNLDEMNVYTDADGNPVENEQLNKVKVSDVEGDANVAGVFVNWEHDDAHDVDEINMAMTGDMIIRIAQGVTVSRGDLLMSAGDGTAKPQGDDIVRSKTIAKVTSTHVTCTYADGSFCVPCVLMAC